MQVLTVSRLRAYRKCPTLHWRRYEQGYEPVREEEALVFGSLWHDCLQALYETIRDIQPKACAVQRGYEAAMRRLAQVGDGFARVRAEVLLGAYCQWLEDNRFSENYIVLAVEQFFAMPLVNPDSGRRSSRHVFAGKVDAILRVKADGRVRVMEHKTTSESIDADADYWERLLLDGQISGYVLAVETEFAARGEPIRVDEVLYDVVRESSHSPGVATPPEKRNYRIPKTDEEKSWKPDDPRLLYKGQRDHDETPEEFKERLERVVAESPQSFVGFRVIARDDEGILRWARNAWTAHQKILIDRRSPFVDQNDHACHQYGVCGFWPVCSRRASVEDETKYRRRAWPHPELPPPNEWPSEYRAMVAEKEPEAEGGE